MGIAPRIIPAKAMPRPLSLLGSALILLSDKIPNTKAMGNSGSPKGRGMALAGIIIPSVAMVVGLIVLFIYLIDFILSGEKLGPW